jgi:hypothetical protein
VNSDPDEFRTSPQSAGASRLLKPTPIALLQQVVDVVEDVVEVEDVVVDVVEVVVVEVEEVDVVDVVDELVLVLVEVLLVDVPPPPGAGHTAGAGADFRLSIVASFLATSPPNSAQYLFVSVPTLSTTPTFPLNGVAIWTPAPLQTAFTIFCFTSTTRHGSAMLPTPLYL